jgi:hypothetical protein
MALAMTLTAGLSLAERAAAFGETAARAYRFTNRARETETGAGSGADRRHVAAHGARGSGAA